MVWEGAAPRWRRSHASPVFRSQTASGRAPPAWVDEGGTPRTNGWVTAGTASLSVVEGQKKDFFLLVY